MKTVLKWPVAQVREDGTPAVWLSHTNWLNIRDGLIRRYLQCREWLAVYEVIKEFGQTTNLEVMGTVMEKENAATALELYSVGYHAWKKHAPEFDTTPERLVQLGDARAAAESGIRRKQLETKVKEAA